MCPPSLEQWLNEFWAEFTAATDQHDATPNAAERLNQQHRPGIKPNQRMFGLTDADRAMPSREDRSQHKSLTGCD
jgi:hypothetical protein